MTLLSFVTDPRKGWGSKAMAIAALVYLISPIDRGAGLHPGPRTA